MTREYGVVRKPVAKSAKGTRRLKKAERRQRDAEIEDELGYTTGKEAGGRSKQEGVVSVKDGRRIPTGRIPDKHGCIGNGDPPNARLLQLINGEISVADLSDTEIAAGVPLCDDGKFSVRAAAQAEALPKSVKNAMQKELVARCKRKLDGGALSAISAIVAIVEDEDSEPNAVINAGKYLIDRFMGKTPETVVHTQDKPWQIIQGNITLQTGSRAESRRRRELPDDDEILDAELLEDDDG